MANKDQTTRPRGRRPRRGRPKGSIIPFERDRQRFTIAALWGFRLAGAGPYRAAYWATIATGDEPIRQEDIDGLLIVAGTKVQHTAVTLEKHLDHLVRKANRIPPGSDAWLETSAVTIKAVILAARTGELEIYCHLLDLLIELGWHDVLQRLTQRINEALKSNLRPFESELSQQGRGLLGRLRRLQKA
jgi:hypothetical protein